MKSSNLRRFARREFSISVTDFSVFQMPYI